MDNFNRKKIGNKKNTSRRSYNNNNDTPSTSKNSVTHSDSNESDNASSIDGFESLDKQLDDLINATVAYLNTNSDVHCVIPGLLNMLHSFRNNHYFMPIEKIGSHPLSPMIIPRQYGEIVIDTLFQAHRVGKPKIVKKNDLYHIVFDTVAIFRMVWWILKAEGVPFFFFDPRDKKPVKVVMKGIPSHIPIHKIFYHLEYFFPIKKLHRMTRGSSKIPMPLILMHVTRSPLLIEMFNISKLLGFDVRVEPFKQPEYPTQCFRCQGFFHAARSCHSPPKCVRCGSNHFSKNCNKSINDKSCLSCANCGGTHTASYKHCPVFIKHRDFYKYIIMNRVPSRVESFRDYYEP